MTHEVVHFTYNQFVGFNNCCPTAKKDKIVHNNSISFVEWYYSSPPQKRPPLLAGKISQALR